MRAAAAEAGALGRQLKRITVTAMSAWSSLIYDGTRYGVLLSVVLTTILIVAGRIALDAFVGKYPPEIRRRYGSMSMRAARVRPYVAGLVLLGLVAVLVLGFREVGTTRAPLTFGSAFVFAATALSVFNVFDLLILDWLLFCTIQPRAMILPGTAGMAAYRDYWFHFIGFLKGVGFTLVGGMIAAALWMAFQTFATSV